MLILYLASPEGNLRRKKEMVSVLIKGKKPERNQGSCRGSPDLRVRREVTKERSNRAENAGQFLGKKRRWEETRGNGSLVNLLAS